MTDAGRSTAAGPMLAAPRSGSGSTLADLHDLLARRFRNSQDVPAAFFEAQAAAIARACHDIAARFEHGGRLLVFGEGPQASDAQHVAVEFVHPVIVGKRALPAIALTSDAASLTGCADSDGRGMFADLLDRLAGAHDIALGISADTPSSAVHHALGQAHGRGLLTLSLTGPEAAESARCVDHLFAVPSQDRLVVQEVHETLYHVLWELVHVFFRPATGPSLTTAENASTHAGDGFARALYPFLYDEPTPVDDADVLQEAQASTLDKCREVVDLRRQLFEEYGRTLVQTAELMAARLEAGGKVLAFGNGGSATDAQDAAADCAQPALPGWRRLPALALTADTAIVTAIANDVGFDNVFARQIIAFGDAPDVALAFSTSGNSRNLLTACAEARRRGLLTIAFSGYDGGALGRSGAVDVCFTVRREHIPRIQEGHATLWHALLEAVQAVLSGPARKGGSRTEAARTDHDPAIR